MLQLSRRRSLIAGLSLLLSCTTTTYAYQLKHGEFWMPYIGAEAKMLSLHFEPNFGGNILPKTYAQGNIFGGITFCDMISLEAGYEATPVHNSTVTLDANNIFGKPITPSQATIQYIRSQIKGWHFDVVGMYSLYDPCEIGLLGSIGVGFPKINIYNYTATTVTGGPQNQFAGDNLRVFQGSKTVLRLGLGLQQMWTECIGGRLTVNWANTRQFKSMYNQVGNPGGGINFRRSAKPQDSWSYGIGVFTYF